MSRLLLNLDAGEGVLAPALEADLIARADIVNLALGGHAGEPGLTRSLAAQARDAGCEVCLHPGYPDRANFGRRDAPMPWVELEGSLDAQRAILPEVSWCKLHGSLYHHAASDDTLAATLVAWHLRQGIQTVLAPPDGAFTNRAAAAGLCVLREVFGDRAYGLVGGKLSLLPRGTSGAVLSDAASVVRQIRSLLRGTIPLADGSEQPLQGQTVCIHGDHPTAFENVKAVRQLLDAEAGGSEPL
ncbi:MAG: LamB/YcsF family protein [Opitutales bacterium]